MSILSDTDLRSILGYLSDDRSQILPDGLNYRCISVTYQWRATVDDLPQQARTELEEIGVRHVSDGIFDSAGFYEDGTKHLAQHPEYVDGLIRNMQLRGVRDRDEGSRAFSLSHPQK